MRNTDAVLRSFSRFLASGWREAEALIGPIDPFNDLAADWLQGNWEILVESVLLPGGSGFLEVYGDGAEGHGSSSRVFRPDAQPTHRIICLPKHGATAQDLGTGQKVDLVNKSFWGFVHWNGNKLAVAPPFNAVLLEGTFPERDGDVVVSLEEVEFGLEEDRGL